MTSTQALAQQRFASQSFFILSGLPKGSEFGLDGKIWQVATFSGVKFLPPGLHFFLFSAVPRNDTPETLSSGVGVRHGLLRFFGPEAETVVEEWDNNAEELVSDRIVGGSGTRGVERRRRSTKEVEGSIEASGGTVVSDEYLKGLDKELAPYSEEIGKEWNKLVGFVTEETVARVVGLDEKGNGKVDAVMGSLMDEKELKAAGGKRTWGKKREEEKVEGQEEEGAEGEEEEGLELLRFVEVDVKRSWPKGAVGEDLTRWSQDKSWCLSDAVDTKLGGDIRELLAELQLSFILFTLLHNFSSLTTYKSLFSLICRSSTLVLPVSARQASTSTTSPLLSTETLPLYASFLSLFLDQLSFLPIDFFSNQMPGLDLHLLTELDHLCAALSDAAKEWNSRDNSSSTSTSSGSGEADVWRTVVERWDRLAAQTMERFGWELGMVKGSRKHGYAGEQKRREVEKEEKVEEWTGEVDLEDLEDGEDGPVILEL